MIKVEQDRQENGERDREEDVADIDIPEMDQPASVGCRAEGFARRKGLDVNLSHMADVDESREEHDRQRCAVILDELADVSLEQVAVSEHTADITAHEDEESNHDAQIRRRLTGHTPLSGQDLNALLQVDKGNVESEYIARKPSNVGETIASVRDGKDPVHYERPASKMVSVLPDSQVTLTVRSNT